MCAAAQSRGDRSNGGGGHSLPYSAIVRQHSVPELVRVRMVPIMLTLRPSGPLLKSYSLPMCFSFLLLQFLSKRSGLSPDRAQIPSLLPHPFQTCELAGSAVAAVSRKVFSRPRT